MGRDHDITTDRFHTSIDIRKYCCKKQHGYNWVRIISNAVIQIKHIINLLYLKILNNNRCKGTLYYEIGFF
jgi:hypothetical protein